MGVEITHNTKNSWFGGDEYVPAVYTRNSDYPRLSRHSGIRQHGPTNAQQHVNDLTGTIGYINQTYNLNSMKLGRALTRATASTGRPNGAYSSPTPGR
jgi:hypothetical protein